MLHKCLIKSTAVDMNRIAKKARTRNDGRLFEDKIIFSLYTAKISSSQITSYCDQSHFSGSSVFSHMLTSIRQIKSYSLYYFGKYREGRFGATFAVRQYGGSKVFLLLYR